MTERNKLIEIVDDAAKKRFFEKVRMVENGCHIWIAGKVHNGYGNFKLARKNMKAHRVAWLIENGTIPDKMCVLHKCDVRECVNPEHLFIGTKSDNTHDMIAKGRLVKLRGEKNGQSKLTEEKVLAILHDSRIHRIIAKDYGVNRSAITQIKAGTLWPHVQRQEKRI